MGGVGGLPVTSDWEAQLSSGFSIERSTDCVGQWLLHVNSETSLFDHNNASPRWHS
jgi:hypothetical protein